MINLIEETEKYIKNSPISNLHNKEGIAQAILFKNLTLSNILEYKREFKKTKREIISLLEYGKNINFYTEIKIGE